MAPTPAPISFSTPNLPTPQTRPNQLPGGGMNFQMIVDLLKSKISNEEVRNNFSTKSIANFFTHFLSGNEFFNNIEVKDFSSANSLEVKDHLKVSDSMDVNELQLKSSLHNKILNITNESNEIIFEDEAVIKLKNSPIAFKAKDIFEVIAFMKFIIHTCGSKMEKCDFNNLTKENNVEQRNKLLSFLKEKYQKMTGEIEGMKSGVEKLKDKAEKIKSEINSGGQFIKKKMLRQSNGNNLSQNKEIKNSAKKIEPSKIHASNFKFKEEIGNKQNLQKLQSQNKVENKLFSVNKEIESEIDFEFKNYKENSMVNDYENFLNEPLFNRMAEQYYYGR
jgi:hypothetical protein